ncbi:hypothetical protein [Kribbella ginsengisoli]|uniref:Uncharacterized protein n=1 Tax=Kribbella ginsengisoli TaxID=363865 RepID=A0ABP6YCZ2_9ACTN
MSRSPQPVRRPRGRRAAVPVLIVLVLWIVLFLSALGIAALLLVRGMAVPAVVSSVVALVTAAATVSGALTRKAVAAARGI